MVRQPKGLGFLEKISKMRIVTGDDAPAASRVAAIVFSAPRETP
jgi:hypothetical protein